MIKFYRLTPEETIRQLKTSKRGLSSQEAGKRILKHGTNELKETKKINPLRIFISQFKNVLTGILLAAVLISVLIGEMIEGILITAIIIMNAAIGFFQEYKAEKTVESLKKLSGLKACATRDGKTTLLPSKNLVPGDIISLSTGAKVPADCRILEESNLKVSESSLTGESKPVKKTEKKIEGEAEIHERKNMLFSGTSITKGRVKAVVVKTGMNTEIGKMARLMESTEEKLTPLQIKLENLGKKIGIITLIIAAIVFSATFLREQKLLETLTLAVSLAVAAIPEGLPTIVLMTLAIGIMHMIRKRVLVRKISSVETLGSTAVIATDKTGTLTLDKMTVRQIYADGKVTDLSRYVQEKHPSESEKLLFRIGALCNDSTPMNGKMVGDPTETALIISASKANMDHEALRRRFKRIDEIPFDSERKAMSTIHRAGHSRIMYTKGAPDVVLNMCSKVSVKGRIKKLTRKDKKEILAANEKFSSSALRVLGFAYKNLTKGKQEKDLVFVGLQAMIDPPREGVKESIQKCKKAGIKVVMITGDHPSTALAIAKELGIKGKSITGKELSKIKNLKDIVEDIAIYARVNPEHKMKIIEALKKRKNITAMTGDGVNDAPALKAADIGVSMGINGTDIARESSDMVLLDNNFSSITNAVEEGRSIFDNLKRFVYFLLSSNLAEVLIIFLAVIIGLKAPLYAIQILWINLITDGFPAIALGLEPKSSNVMKKKPRNPEESIIDKNMILRLLVMGGAITATVLGIYIWSLNSGSQHPEVYAVTMTFTSLVVFELLNALAAKSETKNMFSSLLSNKLLLGAIALSFLLQLAVLYTPLSSYFHTTPLSLSDWLLIACTGSIIFIADTAYKRFKRSEKVCKWIYNGETDIEKC